MTEFSPNIIVSFGEVAYDTVRYYLTMEAPDFNGLLYDVEKLCKEILAANIQQIVDEHKRILPIAVRVRYEIMGIGKTFEQVITQELFDKLKRQTPEEKQIDIESLKGDIEYGVTMLRTYDPEHWMKQPHIVWQYHILNKHFGLPIPDEINKAAAEAQK